MTPTPLPKDVTIDVDRCQSTAKCAKIRSDTSSHIVGFVSKVTSIASLTAVEQVGLMQSIEKYSNTQLGAI